MMILSPSILAADFAKLGEQIGEVESTPGADYIHFDVMDGMFVPNISFGIPVLESLRRITSKTLDVHLMIEKPERYIDKFADAGADIITVHYEACSCIDETLDAIHARGLKAGLSVKPGTDISVLRPYYSKADMFLVMTVEPGFGGQGYIDATTEKIRKLRSELNAAGLDKDIQVDGGITRENVTVVLDAGANVLVMGSSVFKGNITDNINYFNDVFKQYS